MLRASLSGALCLLALCLTAACVTARPMLEPDGRYVGPGLLRMAVDGPRAMGLPPSRTLGVATLARGADGTLLVSVQLRAGGQPCTLVMAPAVGGFWSLLQPGRCAAAIDYEGIPLDVRLRFTAGNLSVGGGGVAVRLAADFEAFSAINGRSVRGVSTWALDGRRP